MNFACSYVLTSVRRCPLLCTCEAHVCLRMIVAELTNETAQGSAQSDTRSAVRTCCYRIRAHNLELYDIPAAEESELSDTKEAQVPTMQLR